MVYNTGETSEELRAKYNPEGSKLRKSQLRMVDMLLYLDRIFRENNIDYMLCAGNILGAVRHEGEFIPWDDDLDIKVLRKDFKRAQQVILDNPHPQYVLQNHDTDPGYMGQWAVLRDTKSEYIKKSVIHNIRKYRGIQIDIFPWDNGIPFWVRYCASQMQARLLEPFIKIKFFKIANALFYLMYKVLFPMIIHICNKRNSNKYYPTLGTGWFIEYEESTLFPTKPIIFEGHQFPGPAKLDKYLKETYGDYMSLPPLDKRNQHEAEYNIWD